jgi:hypothetical protein
MGCSSCGALYSPAPGDKGVCDDCRSLLPSDPAWRSGAAGSSAPATKPMSVPGPRPAAQPIGSIAKRPGAFSALRPNFRRSRLLKRIAIGVVCAAALAGGAAWLLTHERSLSDVKRAIQRQSPSQAWAAVERHASDAWVAIKSKLPFFDEKPARPAPAPSRAAVRESTATRSTHHRSQQTQVANASKKKRAQQAKDDFSAAGNTP